MEFKGTKREWKLKKNSSYFDVETDTIYGESKLCVNVLLQRIKKEDGRCVIETDAHCDEAEANAKLIASAPELLESLQGILKWSAHFPEAMNDELQKAKEIILRATE